MGPPLRKVFPGSKIAQGAKNHCPRLYRKAATLYAPEVSWRAGETEFADMRAGYDALPEETKRRIEPLKAYHSVQYLASG